MARDGHCVYIIGLERYLGSKDEQPMKIGHAVDAVRRLGDFQTANYQDLTLIDSFVFSDAHLAKMAEKIFHGITEHLRVRGEWVYAIPLVPRTILGILQAQGDKLPLWFDQNWLEQQDGPHQNH